jgi:peptidyl-prolyl cis-trans isomerase B (cyclophilin B)
MKKRFLYMIVSCIMLLALASCGTPNTGGNASATAAPTAAPTATPSAQEDTASGNTVNIEIEMQDGGIIKAELYPDIAPITVANFVKLCSEGFYDGLIFHRVIPGFMIQGGAYDVNNNKKEAASIKGEFSSNGVENNLKHTRGVLSMARTQDKDSASSQFFIMHADYPSLNGEYAAFGKVTEGMDVVDKIAETQTTALDRMFGNYPVTPQVIKTIRVVE